jgi:flagellar secretion chaperone FliS
MQRNNPWQSYRKVATQTATPGQLVLMLYDGAIRFSEQALTGFQHKDPVGFNQTIHNNIQRASAIIQELNTSLDMRRGGEVSANFRRLYNYMYRRLLQANIRKEREPIEEVIGRLKVLRESWAEMLKQGPNPVDREDATELQAA